MAAIKPPRNRRMEAPDGPISAIRRNAVPLPGAAACLTDITPILSHPDKACACPSVHNPNRQGVTAALYEQGSARYPTPMLKTRIIPCLDVKDGRVVKGINFVDLIDAGDPVEAAAAYDAAGADEL